MKTTTLSHMQSVEVCDLHEVASFLLAGNIGIIPSDTVYGLMACAQNKHAVQRLYSLKHREHKPGTLIAANVEQFIALGLPKDYLQRIKHLWPAPLSVVVPVAHLEYLDLEVGGLAVRIPADGHLQKLLQRTGPLVTTSANPPGKPVATTLQEATNYFQESVDFYVDGGKISGRPPSTVVRIVNGHIEVLRAGAVQITNLQLTNLI